MKIFERLEDSFDRMMHTDYTKDRGKSVTNAFFIDASPGIFGESRFIGYKLHHKDDSFTFHEQIIQDRRESELMSNSNQIHLEYLVKKHEKIHRDTYMTIGSYYGNAQSRDIEHVMFVDRFVFDIDGPEHQNIPANIRDNLLDQIEDILGKADYVIDSGRGFQMVYQMMMVENIFQSKEAYDQVVEHICKLIEEILPKGYHCDPLTINSYYRIPGTWNTKAEKKARICRHCFQKRAKFSEICERLNIDRTKRKVFYGERPKHKKVNIPPREMTGLYADYLKIAASGNMIGRRNKTIYAFAFNMAGTVQDEERLLDMALNINNNFTSPLPASEVKTTVKSALRQHIQNPVRYGIEKQLDYLGLKEEDVPELETIAERDARRKAQAQKKSKNLAEKRKAIRTAAKRTKMGQVYALSKKGMNHSEIARMAGLSRPTVLKYLTEVLSWFISEDDIARVRKFRKMFMDSISELLSCGFEMDLAGRNWCKNYDSPNNRENVSLGESLLLLLHAMLQTPDFRLLPV